MQPAAGLRLPVIILTVALGGCGLDGHHADLSAVHQGTPGCLDAACHPGFTAAGTVFWDLEGIESAEGVEIVVEDLAGGEARVAVSGPSGLFWAEHALPAGKVFFRAGDQRSELHELPDHAECNLCHQPGGVEGSEGTLVARDVFPPQLNGASPADGSEGVDPDAELVLVFSEPLAPGSVGPGTVRLQGPSGTHPVELLYTEGADTVVLLPDEPLVSAGSYLVVVERGLTDQAGNGLEHQAQVALATASDGAPRVVGSEPAAGEGDVDPATTLTLWVAPSLDASSVDAQSASLTTACDRAGVEAWWSPEDQAVRVRPLLELPGGTTCGLTLEGLVSAEGIAQDGAWTLAFTTWPDGEAPSAIAAVPTAGARAVSTTSAVQLAWNEALGSGTVPTDALELGRPDGEIVDGSTSLIGQVLHWTPSEELPPGETLVVRLTAEFSDTAGNPAVQPAQWSFTVGGSVDQTGPSVRGMSPAEGSVDVPVDATLGLRLSEDPDLTTLDDGVSLASDQGEVAVALSWEGADSLLVVQPLVDLQPSSLYELSVGEALLDLSGNPAGVRVLRFTTTSSADAGAPLFDGLQAVEGVDSSTILLSWDSATDFETPASELVYHAYVSADSGGWDLGVPTATSEPGAVELELGGLEAGTTYWAVVRVEDGDGNIDDNEVELSGAPLVGFAEVAHPILLDACVQCHGDPRTYGGLDVRGWDVLMESGTVIPYNSASSPLMTKGSHYGSGWFTEEEERLVDAWIDQGALDN